MKAFGLLLSGFYYSSVKYVILWFESVAMCHVVLMFTDV